MAVLPITKVRPLVKDLAQMVSAIVSVDSNQDGKVTTLEIANVVQVAIFKIIAQVPNVKEALDQLKDLSPEEVNELTLVFIQHFDLPDDEAEDLVEMWLQWVVSGYLNVKATIRAAKRPNPKVVA